MSTTGQRRTRAQRVAAHVAYEGIFDRAEELLVANHGLTKIGLVLLTTFLLCLITQAWKAPFKFTLYEKVDRDIVCKTPFSVISEAKTIEARRNARLDTPIIYCNDASKIKALKMNLENTIQSFLRNESYEAMPLEEKQKWKSQFLPTGVSDDAAAAAFKNLQNVFEKDPDLNRFKESMDRVFMPFEKNGILLKLHGARDGNQEKIVVYDIGTEPNTGRETAVRDVLIGNAYQIKEWLNREFDREIAEMLFQRIRPIVPETLTENHDETVKAQNRAEERVQPVSVNYEPGQVLVKINSILELDMLTLLKAEHLAYLAQRTFAEKITRFTGVLILAMCMLLLTYFMACGAIFRSGRQLTLGNMGTVFTLMIITTLIGKSIQMLMYNQGASPELMPIVMYAQTVSIAFSWEIAV
ncbi:MAG: hypothetical protein IKW74_02205, partial [Thermoguttaceae bacterium]|nr:hypothetical protein [Thermoguttaceae bacterium]